MTVLYLTGDRGDLLDCVNAHLWFSTSSQSLADLLAEVEDINDTTLGGLVIFLSTKGHTYSMKPGSAGDECSDKE
jgi:hypothetical protein